MAGGAAQVHQTPFGQQDDALAVREDDVVDLRLDVVPAVLAQAGDLDFAVEVADVAHDGVVAHGLHVVMGDHADVAGAGDENVGLAGHFVHAHHAVAFHGGLQGADRVDLGHPNGRAKAAQRLGAALAHVTVTQHHSHLAGHHDVGSALDAVHQRFAATVQVVELRLGDRVVHVEGRERQHTVLLHLVQAMHAGRGFFGHALDVGQTPGVPVRINGQVALDRGKQGFFFLVARTADGARVGFGLAAEHQQQGGIAAIVQDHVGRLAFGPFEDAVAVFPVFVEAFTLEGEHRNAGRSDGSSSVVLGRENVARGPAHFGAQCHQRFDQHAGLDGHVQAAGNAGTAQRLGVLVFFAQRHQSGHFGFGDGQFLAAPVGELDVGYQIIGKSVSHSVHEGVLDGATGRVRLTAPPESYGVVGERRCKFKPSLG